MTTQTPTKPKPINMGKFIIHNGEPIYCKYCNFDRAILNITKELSLPLTIFEDIKRRGIKRIRFINTNHRGELANAVWEFDFAVIDKIKRETKMFQETQYYFSVKDKLKGVGR